LLRRTRASISFHWQDLPIEYGILPVSQMSKPCAVDHVPATLADPVGRVVAREELIAFEALDLIKVEYELLTTISDPEEALATPSPASRLRR